MQFCFICGSINLTLVVHILETMAEHVHYLQQRFDTQLPGKAVELEDRLVEKTVKILQ